MGRFSENFRRDANIVLEQFKKEIRRSKEPTFRKKFLLPVAMLGLATLTTDTALLATNHFDSNSDSAPAPISASLPLWHDAINLPTEQAKDPPTSLVPKVSSHPVSVPKQKSSPPPPEAATPSVDPQPTPPPREDDLSHKVKMAGIEASVRITMIDPETQAHLDAMNLTEDGFTNFWQNIDTSYLEYSQEFIEFNPHKVAIEQGPSEIFFEHYTAWQYWGDGKSVPSDQMDVKRFIRSVAQRFDDPKYPDPGHHICCGTNWVIDPYGRAIQTAPLNAKLRTQLGFDGNTTAVEAVALRQSDISTKQLESQVYLTVGVLMAQGRLDKAQLAQIMQGHGEATDNDMIAHPDNPKKLELKDDFDEPLSSALRQKTDEFLKKYPEVKTMKLNFDKDGTFTGLQLAA